MLLLSQRNPYIDNHCVLKPTVPSNKRSSFHSAAAKKRSEYIRQREERDKSPPRAILTSSSVGAPPPPPQRLSSPRALRTQEYPISHIKMSHASPIEYCGGQIRLWQSCSLWVLLLLAMVVVSCFVLLPYTDRMNDFQTGIQMTLCALLFCCQTCCCFGVVVVVLLLLLLLL